MDSSVSAFAVYKSNPRSNLLSKSQKKRLDKKKKKKTKHTTIHNEAYTNVTKKRVNTSDTIMDEKIDGIRKKKKQLAQNILEPPVLKELSQKLKQKSTKKTKNIAMKKPLKEKVKEPMKVKRTKNSISIEKIEIPELTPVINGSMKVKRTKNSMSIEKIEIPELTPVINGSHRNEDDVTSNNSFEFIPTQIDSREQGLKVFKWMIAPFDSNEFLSHVWEKKPLHITRKKPKYYKNIISTPIIDQMLRNENIQFTKNIDITSYTNGKRETHNPEGRAHPHVVWDYYVNGCSIRLLNPQTYIPKLHTLNATLQEYFNSFVGANAYLTPPDSQGFAPHYDDIEAFILQIEGKKHWKIYLPRSENELLPRVSSKNFDQDEIGPPMMEITLGAGDMLYFPRGFIHQGVTVDGEHSLHVTVSMYQKHSWADLFEKMIPAALYLAINENVELRQGLPFDIYDNFGLVNSDMNTPQREEITNLIMSLFEKIRNHLPIDEAVDQMNKNFQQDALPPVLTDTEKACTVYGDSDQMIEEGKVVNRVEISLDTRIRLLRKNILRMVSEEDSFRIYYHTENSLEYHGNGVPFLEIDENLAPAIETLVVTYPEYVTVEKLEIDDDSDKLQIADTLWSRGLIMTEYPLENIDDD